LEDQYSRKLRRFRQRCQHIKSRRERRRCVIALFKMHKRFVRDGKSKPTGPTVEQRLDEFQRQWELKHCRQLPRCNATPVCSTQAPVTCTPATTTPATTTTVAPATTTQEPNTPITTPCADGETNAAGQVVGARSSAFSVQPQFWSLAVILASVLMLMY
jgi:hypothetical protein